MDTKTIRDAIFWSYANTAMAHYALSNELSEYDKSAFAIRSRLYKGLCDGRMNIASLYDDEKARLKTKRECVYCSTSNNLSLDHLIAKSIGGTDSADNLVYACRSCNSSKGDNDLLAWYVSRNEFPPLLVLRRYLKLLLSYCSEHDLLDYDLSRSNQLSIPFRVDLLSLNFPRPKELRL